MTRKIDKKPIASNNRKYTAARPRFWMAIASALCIASLVTPLCYAQTAATGAINGTITDPSHAVVTGASIKVTSLATGETRTAATGANGSYTVPLLPPGLYTVAVSAQGFKSASHPAVPVNVTETAAVNFQLEVGASNQSVTVTGNAAQLNTENSSLGQVVSQREVVGLPLVTRNYTQIIALSPGVTSDANNANQLGRGTGGEDPQFFAHGGTYAHGVPSNDNNFQMNGVPIDDLEETGTFSGGIAIPNPDTIEQFRVQTGQYDASFGNGAGANVDLITRGGTNQFHGTLFEFFRNDALNANDFFANRTGAKRPVLRQNQFGGTVGGPIVRNKAFFFGSYQGTRQANGIASGCSLTVASPPFTDDRSRAALGALFGGQTGLFGGVAVAPDGSNINPVALALFQMKLPNGQYLIPTPQKIIGGVGSSFLSSPCAFSENQYMANGDYDLSNKSIFSARFFQAKSNQTVSFPIGEISPLPGTQPETFRNISFAHTYVFGPTAVNEARFGYHRTSSLQTTPTSFTFSSLGSLVPPQDDSQPNFILPGLEFTGGAGPTGWSQDHLTFEDTFSLTKGKHDMTFGGGTRRAAVNTVDFNDQANLIFLTYPDFLLGLSAAQNGSFFSNIYESFDFLGFPQRNFKVWDRWAFAQDNVRLTQNLTVNLGLRYEKIGEFYDSLGRNANLDPTLLNPNPPASGTLAGYVVPSNYSGGAIPAGVTKLDNGFGIKGTGQNKVSPRVGFAWQVKPQTVLRGGYGIYYTRPNGQVLLQLSENLPFSTFRFPSGFANAVASLQEPFPPPLLAPSDFPLFLSYSPTTQLTTTALSQNYQPAWLQEFSLNVQQAFARDWTGEIGYVGTRMTRLPDTHGINQAALASPGNPIRGQTTNTLANIPLRSPYLGWSTPGLLTIDSEGYGWYNGLETSLSKRFSHGLQLLASYTFSKTTASNGANATESGQGIPDYGNQNDPRSRYGPTDFNRKHRFVLSFLYQFPSLNGDHAIDRTVLNGWSISGTALFQSGQSMTLTGTNGNNIFGTTSDLAQLATGCHAANLVTPGSVNKKLGNYFNKSCVDGLVQTGFPQWAPLDGGTNFGNSGVGSVEGPGQHNVDLAFIKNTSLRWPNNVSNLEFRAELFNAFNSPQFANPDPSVSDSTFGQITASSVNSRIVQFALKLMF
jgi:Carboxypeptidase regulatory-like domain/TonB-dependent Receptor Plug Domain/TonB dependent receptor